MTTTPINQRKNERTSLIIDDDPCKKFACEWQYCLKKHDFREERCQNLIEQLRKCCIETFASTSGPISPTCSGFLNKRTN